MIKEFRLVGYRCFEDTDWVPVGKLAVLIGKNDGGKSSAILALQTVLEAGNFGDGDHRLLGGVPGEAGGADAEDVAPIPAAVNPDADGDVVAENVEIDGGETGLRTERLEVRIKFDKDGETIEIVASHDLGAAATIYERYEEMVEPESLNGDLDRHTIVTLRAVAADIGVAIPPGVLKAQIIETLEAHRGTLDTEYGPRPATLAADEWRRMTTREWQSIEGPGALLVHGVMSGKEDMNDAARILTGLGEYSAVCCFDYDWKDRIQTSAQRLEDWIERRQSNRSIDIFGHSLGGIVSRETLRSAETAARVSGLMAMGSPHEGVPIDASQAWFLYFASTIVAPSLAQVLSSSSFIADLKQTPAPRGVSTACYIGTNHASYAPLGAQVGRGLKLLPQYWFLTFDGIVPVESADWNLARANQRAADLNHGELNSDSDLASREAFRQTVRWWLNRRGRH